MPDIRYVCFSDMHFGADNSLMTYMQKGCAEGDPRKTSLVAAHLMECLKTLISKNEKPDKPKLILMGDILELALTTDNRAAMAFERFLELIMPNGQDPLVDKTVFYLPGNHDHHLWETARETQYRKFIGTVAEGVYLDVPWHATSAFIEPPPKPPYERLPSDFLNMLAHRVRGTDDVMFATAYPNFGLMRKDQQRCVMFHHGHLTESIYLLMSTLNTMIFPDRKRPTHVWDIEEENFAWIDFFWSAMGRSGQVGQNVELVYDSMQEPEAFGKLMGNLGRSIADRLKLRWWLRPIAKRVLGRVMEHIGQEVVKPERFQSKGDPKKELPAAVLSDDTKKGLQEYVSGALREQILIERKQTLPPEVIFVFGHTHKPFEQVMAFDGYQFPVEVYNSGGWVVDAKDPTPVIGGAAILVDENLNVASLRLYNEAIKDANPPSVKVAAATSSCGVPNPFAERLTKLVEESQEGWSAFSATTAEAVTIHRESLHAHIEKEA